MHRKAELAGGDGSSKGKSKQVRYADDAAVPAPASMAALSDMVMTPVKRAVTSPTLQRAVISSLVVGFIVLVSFGTAILAYGLFYYNYVPQIGTTREVSLQYGHNKPPYGFVDLPAFATDQVYDITLDLIVPATPKNIDLGNFMVDFDIQAADGRSVVTTSRASSLTWSPAIVRNVQTLLKLPLYLLTSYSPSTQHLHIPLISKRVLKSFTTRDLSRAHVSIGRRDAHHAVLSAVEQADAQKQQQQCMPVGYQMRAGEELQVYKATLTFRAHLHGIRYVMYYHRIISFCVFSALFFFVTLSSALLSWALFSFFRRSVATPLDNNVQKEASSSSDATSSPRVKIEPISPHAQFEHVDLAEASDSQVREKEWDTLRGSLSRGMDEEEGSLLGHIKFEQGPETEREEVKTEEDDQEVGTPDSPGWHDVKEEEREEEDDKTISDSASTAPTTLSVSRLSNAPSGVSTSASSVSSQSPSMRQRASSTRIPKTESEEKGDS